METIDLREFSEGRQILKQAAEARGVMPSFFYRKNNVIDKLLVFMNTGELAKSIKDRTDVPEFVQPRLLRAGEGLYSPVYVERSPHPVVPVHELATVIFTHRNEIPAEVPQWRVRQETDEDTTIVGEGLQIVFDSIRTLKQNLQHFTDFVSIPPVPEDPSIPTLGQWLYDRLHITE